MVKNGLLMENSWKCKVRKIQIFGYTKNRQYKRYVNNKFNGEPHIIATSAVNGMLYTSKLFCSSWTNYNTVRASNYIYLIIIYISILHLL